MSLASIKGHSKQSMANTHRGNGALSRQLRPAAQDGNRMHLATPIRQPASGHPVRSSAEGQIWNPSGAEFSTALSQQTYPFCATCPRRSRWWAALRCWHRLCLDLGLGAVWPQLSETPFLRPRFSIVTDIVELPGKPLNKCANYPRLW